jgi:hypothetical protein
MLRPRLVHRTRYNVEWTPFAFFVIPCNVVAHSSKRQQNHSGKQALEHHNGRPARTKSVSPKRQLEHTNEINESRQAKDDSGRYAQPQRQRRERGYGGPGEPNHG